jgi:hypothetical protein
MVTNQRIIRIVPLTVSGYDAGIILEILWEDRRKLGRDNRLIRTWYLQICIVTASLVLSSRCLEQNNNDKVQMWLIISFTNDFPFIT